MKKIRDITQLRLTTQMGERQIARALRVSRTVVSKTLAQYRASGLKAELIAEMGDSALEEALWQKDRVIDTPRYKALEKRFPAMLQELKKRGMTLERLWQEYVEEEAGGYQYSQFCRHFQRWTAAGELWMHQDYKAGEWMFADWAGDPLVVVNAITGAEWPILSTMSRLVSLPLARVLADLRLRTWRCVTVRLLVTDATMVFDRRNEAGAGSMNAPKPAPCGGEHLADNSSMDRAAPRAPP